MKFVSTIEDQTGTLQLEGEFTFDTHLSFKACTQELLKAPALNRIILDMTGVSRMDASSLGALLILRESAQARLATLALLRPSPEVMSLLGLVHFEKLFEIIS
jgi:anti-anti-sigma factor